MIKLLLCWLLVAAVVSTGAEEPEETAPKNDVEENVEVPPVVIEPREGGKDDSRKGIMTSHMNPYISNRPDSQNKQPKSPIIPKRETKRPWDGVEQESRPPNGPILDGLGPETNASTLTNELVKNMLPTIIQRICGKSDPKCLPSDNFKVKTYREQVVAGSLYFIKLSISGVYYHVSINTRIWESAVEVVGVKGPVEEKAPIEYFPPGDYVAPVQTPINGPGVVAPVRPGGVGDEQVPNYDIQSIVKNLRFNILEKICIKYDENCPKITSKIKVKAYKQQVVEGALYFVKVNVNGVDYVVRIFDQAWTKTLNVEGVNKLENDESSIEPIEADPDSPTDENNNESYIEHPDKPPKVGVKSDEKRPDDEIRRVVASVRPALERIVCNITSKVGKCPKDSPFVIKAYTHQLVAGSVYNVKLLIGDSLYHATIHSQPWLKKLKLIGVKGPVKNSDPLDTLNNEMDSQPMVGPGGISQTTKLSVAKEKDANELVKSLVESARADIITRICVQFLNDCPPKDTKVIAKTYREQIVNGIVYRIKVAVGNRYYHVKILHQPWKQIPRTILNIKGPMGEKEPIDNS